MLKGRRYMESDEFKTRQTVFEFFCAKSVEFLKTFKDDCMTGWNKLLRKAMSAVQTQMHLDFSAPINVYWLIESMPRMTKN